LDSLLKNRADTSAIKLVNDNQQRFLATEEDKRNMTRQNNHEERSENK